MYFYFANVFADVQKTFFMFVNKILNAFAFIKQAFAVFVDNGLKVANVFDYIAYVLFNRAQNDATPFETNQQVQKKNMIWFYKLFLHRISFRRPFVSFNRCRHFFNLLSQLLPTMCWPIKWRPFNLLRKNFKASWHSHKGSWRYWYEESLNSFFEFAFKCNLNLLHESWNPWMDFTMRFRLILLWSEDPNCFSSVPISCKHAIRLAVTPRTVTESIYRWQHSSRWASEETQGHKNERR